MLPTTVVQSSTLYAIFLICFVFHCFRSSSLYSRMNLFFRQENVNTVTVTPTSGAVLFRKDSSQALNNPSRPSSLQVNNSPVNSPPSSSPIPVPTQVAAYKRMCSSPSSPQTTCKQIVGSSGQLVKKVCRFELFYTHNFLH